MEKQILLEKLEELGYDAANYLCGLNASDITMEELIEILDRTDVLREIASIEEAENLLLFIEDRFPDYIEKIIELMVADFYDNNYIEGEE